MFCITITKAPVLNLSESTPAEMDYYYSTLSFSGTFSDGNLSSAILDDISSLSWEILGTSDGGTWTEGELSSGTFTATLDSSVYTGSKTIKITATDDNGNTTVLTRTLLDHEAGPSVDINEPLLLSVL